MRRRFIADFTGYSMYPFLKPGDRLIITDSVTGSIEVGDVVVIRGRHNLVAHRLVKILPDKRLVLKGDSLLKPDPEPVPESHIAGRVEAVLRNNRMISISKGPRSYFKRLYAFVNIKNLTYGAIRLRSKLILKRIMSPESLRSIDREWGLIICLLCNRSWNSKDEWGCLTEGFDNVNRDLNLERVRTIAHKEGIAGALYYYSKKGGIHIPAIKGFKKIYENIAARNLTNLQRLKYMDNALKNEGLDIMALKGASLFFNIYEGIGIRPMGDLDLMVLPQERSRFERLLDSTGYKRDRSIAHLFKKQGTAIDIHIHALNTDRIFNRNSLFPAGMEPIWKNSVPLKKGFQRIRRPDDIDNVLLLSQHMMKHSFSSLIWINDIHELLLRFDSNSWKRLSRRAKQLGQQRCLAYSIYLINRLFMFKTPDGLWPRGLPLRLSFFEKGILNARIRGSSINRIGPLFSILCISGLANKIRFILETVFPKKRVINEEFGDFRGARRFILYPRRILQAVVTLFRQCSLIIMETIIKKG